MATDIDPLDSKALGLLMQDGRMTWSDLAGELGLSAPATAERVRRLEERGLLTGYRAIPDPAAVGYEILAFIYVILAHAADSRATFTRLAQKHPGVLECHHIAGEEDFLLKVRCRSIAELDQIISKDLKGKSGVLRTRTTIALSTLKETTAIPVD
jgi:Lrp/AsnC family transcriptional regulator, leucine-responsive regulatory protein